MWRVSYLRNVISDKFTKKCDIWRKRKVWPNIGPGLGDSSNLMTKASNHVYQVWPLQCIIASIIAPAMHCNGAIMLAWLIRPLLGSKRRYCVTALYLGVHNGPKQHMYSDVSPILLHFTYFCVEQKLTQNLVCGEKITNIIYVCNMNIIHWILSYNPGSYD